MWHRHNWTLWETKEEGKLTRKHADRNLTLDYVLIQQRRCLGCGKIELNQQVTNIEDA